MTPHDRARTHSREREDSEGSRGYLRTISPQEENQSHARYRKMMAGRSRYDQTESSIHYT